jgi:single-stranded DNA-binding protein
LKGKGKDQNGKAIDLDTLSFRIAVKTTRSSGMVKNEKGEEVKDYTSFIQVDCIGQIASMNKHLKKGETVTVIGELVNRRYVDKEGANSSYTFVAADQLYINKALPPREQAANA